MAISSCGRLFVWGRNDKSQLGLGFTKKAEIQRKVYLRANKDSKAVELPNDNCVVKPTPLPGLQTALNQCTFFFITFLLEFMAYRFSHHSIAERTSFGDVFAKCWSTYVIPHISLSYKASRSCFCSGSHSSLSWRHLQCGRCIVFNLRRNKFTQRVHLWFEFTS